MNKFLQVLAGVALLCPTLNAQEQEVVYTTPAREHRAIWMSPYLDSTWPGGQVTESTAASRLKTLDSRMKGLAEDGINVIYYHARAFCDATYESSYEPWAYTVGGTRGTKPGIDVFSAVVEYGHKYGIEVYAWVNPYRYSNGNYYGGNNPLNYETSHPDWLLKGDKQIILNPAIPEVQQRVEDICREIATKYDIDGMIFDDYFYHSSVGLDLDADYYAAYEAAYKAEHEDTKGMMTQKAWRRENVNETVRRVHDVVKEVRPYAVFAISPAGRISPDDIGDYGLEPGPYGDMNYDGLFADPIKWLNNGWLDFLSPQVYWVEYYDKLTDWYSVAVPHFGRHLYSSVDVNRMGGAGGAAEYLRQIESHRSHLRPNESGVVFFDLGTYVNYREKWADSPRTVTFGNILSQTVFQHPAMVPMRYWHNDYKPVMVSNIRREGNLLKWDGPADQTYRRYVIYALPANQSAINISPEAVVAIRYDESYEIQDESAVYGVAVYDRYGMEYSTLFENATVKENPGVSLVYPADGEECAPLFDMKWSHPSGKAIVEVAEDANFTVLVGQNESCGNILNSAAVGNFEAGKEYFWRVKSHAANYTAAVSPTGRFKVGQFEILSPVAENTGLSPKVEWNACAPGVDYKVEISTTKSFDNVVYSANLTTNSITVPAKTLVSGKAYFVRVTAAMGNAHLITPVVGFNTADVADYDAPAILTPATDGATMHVNESVVVASWEGMQNVGVEICENTTFPARSSYKGTLRDFQTVSAAMGDIKIQSKALVDGKTYYLRVRGSYNLLASPGAVYTDYGPVRSFVYSSAAGVSDVADNVDAATISADGVVKVAEPSLLEIFDISGRLVESTRVADRYSVAHLGAGCFIIRVSASAVTTLKWIGR